MRRIREACVPRPGGTRHKVSSRGVQRGVHRLSNESPQGATSPHAPLLALPAPVQVWNDRVFESPEGVRQLYSDIRYEVDGPVVTNALSKPATLKARADVMGREIHDAVVRACDDPSVVGIVVTGDGRAFRADPDMQILDGLASSDPADARASASADVADPTDPVRSGGEFDNRFGSS